MAPLRGLGLAVRRAVWALTTATYSNSSGEVQRLRQGPASAKAQGPRSPSRGERPLRLVSERRGIVDVETGLLGVGVASEHHPDAP